MNEKVKIKRNITEGIFVAQTGLTKWKGERKCCRSFSIQKNIK